MRWANKHKTRGWMKSCEGYHIECKSLYCRQIMFIQIFDFFFEKFSKLIFFSVLLF